MEAKVLNTQPPCAFNQNAKSPIRLRDGRYVETFTITENPTIDIVTEGGFDAYYCHCTRNSASSKVNVKTLSRVFLGSGPEEVLCQVIGKTFTIETTIENGCYSYKLLSIN